jgi:hypothetical protein
MLHTRSAVGSVGEGHPKVADISCTDVERGTAG